MTGSTRALKSRPGVDGLFSAILPKPLDLPNLFRLIEKMLSDPRQGTLIDEAERQWRERGLDRRPSAKVVPEPTREQTLAVGVLFNIVDWPQADLILLTDEAAAPSLEFVRARSDAFLLPVVDLSGRLGDVADTTFRASATETWSDLAAVVDRFDRQRARLPEQYRSAADLGDRLLAYLSLSNRPLAPISDASRRSCVRYAGFFPEAELVAAAERLVHRGLLSRRFVDRFHTCSACSSHRLNVREECPKCRSPNLCETALVHHFKCAHRAGRCFCAIFHILSSGGRDHALEKLPRRGPA